MNRKKDLAAYVKEAEGVKLNPDSIFDLQSKRMHEYKRQLLNVLHIISDYIALRDNPDLDILPKTYIFGAKAAAGYDMAKQIMRLICYLSEDINKNPKIKEKLNVVYMENYNVTMSEKLMPASEISEQISLAGKEASGTGNMKFMINGALTVGTLDGANVEMAQLAGNENIFIFGLKADEVADIWNKGYNSSSYYNQDPNMRRVIEALIVGFNDTAFGDIANYLLRATPVADPYMCLADYESYCQMQAKISDVYRNDKKQWNKMSLCNIAAAGHFSADRSVREYAKNIWHLKQLDNK